MLEEAGVTDKYLKHLCMLQRLLLTRHMLKDRKLLLSGWGQNMWGKDWLVYACRKKGVKWNRIPEMAQRKLQEAKTGVSFYLVGILFPKS